MKASLLGVALACVGLVSCNMTANGVNFGKLADIGQNLVQAGGISQQQELTLGDEFAAMLLGASRLHPNQQLQTYVNRVGSYLASLSARPDLPWTFAVLDTPDLNAFAIPGGYVFVTSGLLANLQSEAELAAVLAHEIAHVTERHHLREVERQNTLSLFSNIASAAAEYRDENNNSRPSAKAYQNRQIAEQVLKAGQQLYTKGLSRDDELGADNMAVRLTAKAGYDPYALAAVMQQLDSVSAQSGAISLLLATHPSPADRLSAMQHQLASLPHNSGQTLTARFIGALKP